MAASQLLITVSVLLALIHQCTSSEYVLTGSLANMGQPVISSLYPDGTPGGSDFLYNYNAAYMPLFQDDRREGSLLVRVQDLVPNATSPYDVGPSKIAIAYLESISQGAKAVVFDYLPSSQVIIEPSSPADALGTEDPRVSFSPFHNDTYFLFYTAVAQNADGSVSANLALATATTQPQIAKGWTQHGYVFPQLSWSKSGALLARPSPLSSLLFWGDSTLVAGIQVAETFDMLNYIYNSSIWLPVRPNSFDSVLVEAGPSPLQLSNGNYLFLYNSARQNGPSPKPDWTLQYNIGWVVLDKFNPVVIVERCTEPLLSPTADWELGYGGNNDVLGLTPNVVFVEGWQRYPKFELDHFLIYVGGADSVVGVAQVVVQLPQHGSSTGYRVSAQWVR